MNVLITGGAGFLGSALSEKLLALGHSVTVIDNFCTGRTDNLATCQQFKEFNLIQGNILEREVLGKALAKTELVFHLAANPDVRVGAVNSVIDYQQNVTATHNLLEELKQSSSCKKIIFTSSSTVYGEPIQTPTPEDYAPLKPISLYGATKLACEALISGYCHMFSLSGIVLRLANIVGPRGHGIIQDFVRKLSENNTRLEILGNGEQNKSYLFVDDCIDALLLASQIESTYEIFNVGSADRIKVNDIARIVVNEMRLKPEFIYADSFTGRGWRGDVKDMLLDCRRIEERGWHAKHNSIDSVTYATRAIISSLWK